MRLKEALKTTEEELMKPCDTDESLPELPFHPWLREREGASYDPQNHMQITNSSDIRVVNVHQDPEVMGKWHEHGLFSIGFIYGFPLTCVQWNNQGQVAQNGTTCDGEIRLTATFLLPVYLHRILDKACMGNHMAPNCPNSKAPSDCGGFFFRFELLNVRPQWAE